MQHVTELPKTGAMLRRIEEKAARSSDIAVGEAMGVLTAVLLDRAAETALPSGATVRAVCTWRNKEGKLHRGYIVDESLGGFSTPQTPHYRILFDPEHENCPDTILTISLPVEDVAYESKLAHLPDLKPTRFLMSADGKTLSYRQWSEREEVYPICIWVRNDGWTLAAPVDLAIPARNMWQKEWIGVWNYTAGDLYSYHDLTGENTLADWEN